MHFLFVTVCKTLSEISFFLMKEVISLVNTAADNPTSLNCVIFCTKKKKAFLKTQLLYFKFDSFNYTFWTFSLIY